MSGKTKTPALRPGLKTKFTHAKNSRITHGCKCSCGCTLPADAWFMDEWLPELHMLATRFEGAGFTPDLAAMCLCQCYGLFLMLSRQGG